MGSKVQGKVKWFSKDKGYGFIAVPGRKQDLFVHYSAIETRDSGGQRNLEEEQMVEFEIVSGDKGEQADQVVIL